MKAVRAMKLLGEERDCINPFGETGPPLYDLHTHKVVFLVPSSGSQEHFPRSKTSLFHLTFFCSRAFLSWMKTSDQHISSCSLLISNGSCREELSVLEEQESSESSGLQPKRSSVQGDPSTLRVSAYHMEHAAGARPSP